MKIELKPCPFCGGAAEIKIRYGAIPFKYVMCTNCKSQTVVVAYVCDDDTVAEFWNRRVDNGQIY